MDAIKIEGFILKSPHGADHYSFAQHTMEKYGYITVCPYTLEFTIPAEFNPIAAEVAVLNKKIDDMNAEHGQQIKAIKDRIANLLCLEYTPSVA